MGQPICTMFTILIGLSASAENTWQHSSFFCVDSQWFGGVHGGIEVFNFGISINNVLVDDAGVDIDETHIRIVKLSKVILIDCFLELVPETLCDRFEGVVD